MPEPIPRPPLPRLPADVAERIRATATQARRPGRGERWSHAHAAPARTAPAVILRAGDGAGNPGGVATGLRGPVGSPGGGPGRLPARAMSRPAAAASVSMGAPPVERDHMTARISLDPPRTLVYRLAEWYSRRSYGVVAEPLAAMGHNRACC